MNAPHENRRLINEMKYLRQHPFVLAWIAEFQKDSFHFNYPDCHSCGFPHSDVLLCNGAPFGLLYIGGKSYFVYISNVAWMVQFREKNRPGFNWRDDTYFQRTDNGDVRVTSFWQYNNCPQEKVWTIPGSEWASIVSSVSMVGETAESYQQALEFHGKSRETSI
jgi:hypothetical protein